MKGNDGFDIFISHSSRLCHRTHEFVDALAGELIKRGYKLFLDRQTLKPRVELIPTIKQAIRSSCVGILILTKHAIESGWVEIELEEMLRNYQVGRLRLVVLRLETGCPVPPGVPVENIIECNSPYDFIEITNNIASIADDGYLFINSALKHK